MDSLITPFQNAFIQGRTITDNILIAHEIFDHIGRLKGRKNGFGTLKIDTSKAYDRTDWKFLRAVLVAMKFSPEWVHWVMECVTTVQYILLVNGHMTQSFMTRRPLISLLVPFVCKHSIYIFHEGRSLQRNQRC